MLGNGDFLEWGSPRISATSNQAQAFPHTSQQNTHISEAIAAPLPSTDNVKLLENLRRHIQSNTILPSQTPKYASIKHRHFGSNCSAAAIHPQHQTIPHHQATASTSILAEIAREFANTHPIKREPSLTPPKIHINQTLSFRKRLRRRCHPPATQNDSSPSGYCASTSVLAEIARELAKTHPIKHDTSLIHPKIYINQTSPFRK